MDEQPTYYYLFAKGNDFKIREMTEDKAAELWDRGIRFAGVGQRTREEAEALRQRYLEQKRTEH